MSVEENKPEQAMIIDLKKMFGGKKDFSHGFYHLYSKHESEPVLVHGYYCADLDNVFVFGFNTHDGGGLLPLSDLTSDTRIVPVVITEAAQLK